VRFWFFVVFEKVIKIPGMLSRGAEIENAARIGRCGGGRLGVAAASGFVVS
jgi:hypothetical protein